MKKITLTLASSLSILATSAFAADIISYEPEPAPITAPISSIETPAATKPNHDWSGIYVGANGSVDISRFKNVTRYTDLETGDVSRNNWSNKTTGFLGGVQAGYNWQFDDIVAGVETDFQGGNVKKTKYYGYGADKLTTKNRLDWFGTTRARLGYTITPDVMVYGTAGVAYGRVKTSYSTADASFSGSKNKVGYTLGLGSEFALTDELSLKAEYLYTDLGKDKMFNYADAGEAFRGDNKFKMHTIRAGVNFKF